MSGEDSLDIYPEKCPRWIDQYAAERLLQLIPVQRWGSVELNMQSRASFVEPIREEAASGENSATINPLHISYSDTTANLVQGIRPPQAIDE